MKNDICPYRSQCEELRAVLSKRHQDVVGRERADQVRTKQEDKQRQQQGIHYVQWRNTASHSMYVQCSL